ncbi:MAG: flagellar hook-length control protein FliK [Pseudomonadota bacterium]
MPLLNVDTATAVPETGIPLPLQQLLTPPAMAGAMTGTVVPAAADDQAAPGLQLALIESEAAAPLTKGQHGGLLSILQRTLNKPLAAQPPVSPAAQITDSLLPAAVPAAVLAPHPTVMASDAAVKSNAIDLLQMQLQPAPTPSLVASGVVESPLQQTGISLTSPLLSGQPIAPTIPGTLAPPPIATPIHQPQWNAELGSRVLWMVKQDVQTADIKLNPPHLGPLEVRVSMANDTVNVTFSSPHGLVRDALDAAMPRLRDMFMDNGLQLVNANVSNKSFSEQQNPGQGQQQSGGFGDYRADEPGGDSHEGEMMNTVLARLGLVDYYA